MERQEEMDMQEKMAVQGRKFAIGIMTGIAAGIGIAVLIGCHSSGTLIAKFAAVGIGAACTAIGGIIGCAFEK